MVKLRKRRKENVESAAFGIFWTTGMYLSSSLVTHSHLKAKVRRRGSSQPGEEDYPRPERDGHTAKPYWVKQRKPHAAFV